MPAGKIPERSPRAAATQAQWPGDVRRPQRRCGSPDPGRPGPAAKIAGMTAPPATTCELRQQVRLQVLTWPALDQPAPARPASAAATRATPGVEVMVTTRKGGAAAGPYATL